MDRDEGVMSPVNRGVLSYWRGLARDEGEAFNVPARKVLDPLDISPALLPHLFLSELAADPFSVRIRLQGQYLSDRAGQSLVGRFIDADSFGENWQEVLGIYRQLVESRCPIVTRERHIGAQDWAIEAEVLHLPLLGADGAIGFVFGALDRVDLRDDVTTAAQGRLGRSEQWEILSVRTLSR
jgi:hypothetical protein